MSRQPGRIAVLQVITVLLLVLPFVAVGTYAWQKYMWAQARLAELEPRYARLKGMRSMQPELEMAAKLAQTTLHKHSYPATLDATKAGNDAQQRIRTAFESSQLAIGSLQVLEAKESEGFQRISVVLQVEGSLPSIQEAILRIKDQSPTILVDSFSLQNVGPARAASVQRLAGNFSFSVLRAKL